MPEDRRRANITPICKQDKKEIQLKYRSVNFPTEIHPEKVMEIILGAISKNMMNKKDRKISQQGFTSAKTCWTSLISFCNEKTGMVEKSSTCL